MRRHIILLILTVIFASCNNANSSKALQKNIEIPGYWDVLPEATANIKFPRHILLECTLAGQQGYMILDTGASASLLSPLGVNALRSQGIDIGNKRQWTTGTFTWGQKLIRTQFACNGPIGQAIVRSYPNETIFGLIGYPVVKNHCLEIDYVNLKAHLLPNSTPLTIRHNTSRQSVLDLKIDRTGHVFIKNCQVAGTLDGEFHLDTGSPTIINFEPALAKLAGTEGRHLSSIRMGSLILDNVTWSPRKGGRRALKNNNYIGEIGNGFFKNSILRLHYAKKQLEVLRVNSNTL